MSAGGARASRRPSAAARAAEARRRQEVEERLERAGFLAAAVEEPPPWPDPEHDRRAEALRSQLEALGPIFSRLGRYLSTRLDHLPAQDCRTLAALPDRAVPMSERQVRELLSAELGSSGLATLAYLESTPILSRLMSQTHRATLVDGRAVAIRVARSELLADPDLELLPALAPRLSSVGWPFAAVRTIIADFQDLVARELDLRRTAAVLAQLGGPVAAGRLFVAPSVVLALCSSRVLTLEAPASEPLFRGAPPDVDPGAQEMARTRGLADLWMHLSFAHFQIPEELSLDDVRLAPSGGVQLIGGSFRPLAGDDATALWRYLEAAGRDDTDAVFTALHALSTPCEDAQLEALRHQLHHVVARRDGRFGSVPPGLPELLLSHWRELMRHGLAPNPALLAAYRGIVCLRELAGGGLSHEVLREALRVVQIARGSQRLREALRPVQVLRSAESLIDLLADLPRKLAWREARGPAPAAPSRAEKGDVPRRADRGWPILGAGLLLAGSIVIWFARLPTLLGGWTPALQGAALALVGLALLRAIWRS